jgi:hypothetical protein
MTHLCLPSQIGSVSRKTPTQLAESAIEAIGDHRRYGKHKQTIFYAVSLDPAGRVHIDHLDNAPPTEIVMACSFKSSPDDLADALRHEIEARS